MSSGLIFAIVIIAILTVGRIVRAGMELEARKNGFSLKDKRGAPVSELAEEIGAVHHSSF